MIRLWLSIGVASLALAAFAPSTSLAQAGEEASTKQEAASRKTRQLLAQQISIEPTEMPLAKLLTALEKRLPEGKRVSLRIDTKAFGKDAAKLVEAPIRLPKMANVSLWTVVRLALGQVPISTDHRLETDELLITTPARALYTKAYEIRDLVENPTFDPAMSFEVLKPPSPGRRKLNNSEKTAEVVRLIVSVIDPDFWRAATEPHGTIEVVNGSRLVIQANANRHDQVADLLDALRRLSDVSVTIDARLYEVDRELYTKVQNSKRLTRAELAKEMEQGAPADAALATLLKKAKLTVRSKETALASGQEASFLSHHRVLVAPPILRGENLAPILGGNASLTQPSAVLEGVSFAAQAAVSADRRFVTMKITEKAREIDQLPPAQLPSLKKPNAKDAPADIQEQVQDLLDALRRAGPLEPVVSETAHTQEVDIPDGGSRMIAVHVRPRSLQAAERWWLLVLTPCIFINAEEQAIQEQSLQATLPALVRHILTNPRLQTTRAFYGTPDDNRFALVGSERWAWPQAERSLVVPHYQLTPPQPRGKRLLGIRIDDFQWIGKEQSILAIGVTLLNAGGNDNGAVPGGCRLRYVVRLKEKKWEVELTEP